MSVRQDWYHWRLVATALSFTFFGLGGLILGYVIFPLIALFSVDPQARTRRCRLLVHYSFRLFIGIMASMGVLTWSVHGRAALGKPGTLVVANHPSLIDIVFLVSMTPNACCIVKSELYRNFFTRGPVSWAGYIANDSPEQLIEDCAREMAQGATLVVFPEGTRSVGGQPLRFKRGAAYVWLRTRSELVLASIVVSPPTLAKNDKWYQVPTRRPCFSLDVCRADEAGVDRIGDEGQIDARSLNRLWQAYFEQEITI